MSGSLLAGSAPPLTITFAQIPAGLAVPGSYTEIAANYSNQGLFTYPAKVLLMAPIASTGTITPLIAVPIFTPQQADLLFGVGGIGAASCRAFLAANNSTPFWAMGLPNPSSPVANTWSIPLAFAASLTGPPGVLPLYIGGVQIPVTVTPGVDTATTIANDLTGGQFDVVSAQVQTIKTELKIALAASYVAGALGLVVLIRRL